MKNHTLLNKTKFRLVYWLSFIFLMTFIVCPIFFFFYLFNEAKVRDLIIAQFSNPKFHLEIKGKVIPHFWHGLSFEVFNLQIITNDNKRLMDISELNCQLSWIDLIGAKYTIKRVSLNNVGIYENNILANKLFDFSNNKVDLQFLANLSNIQVNEFYSIEQDASYIIRNGTFKFNRQIRNNKLIFSFSLPKEKMVLSGSGLINNIKNNIAYFDDYNIKLILQNAIVNIDANITYNFINNNINLNQINGNFIYKTYYGNINSNNIRFTTNLFSTDNLTLMLKKVSSKNKFNIILNNLTIDNKNQLLIKQTNLKYIYIDNDNIFNSLTQLINLKFDKSGILTAKCNSSATYSNNSTINNSNNLRFFMSGICGFNADSSLLTLSLNGNLNKYPLELGIIVNYSGAKPLVEIKAKANSIKTVGVSNSKLKPLYYDNNSLPFSWMSFLDMNGDILIDNIILNKIYLNKFDLHFNLKNNILNINKFGANIYGGKLTGNAQVIKNKDLYNISTNQKVDNLNLQGIFKDLFDVEAISGTANLELNANITNVKFIKDIHKNFNGKIIINATHGAFQGINLNLFSIPRIDENYTKSTIFDQLNATLNFTNGVSNDGKIKFYSQYVIASGLGNIDFVNNTINYLFTIKSALPPNQQKFKSVIIPVVVKGDLFNPSINIKNIHLDKVHKIINNSIFDNIRDKISRKFKRNNV